MSQTEHKTHNVEEESYFVSMTDLLVGMLFIFIIMLMAFALNLREEQERFDRTTATLTEADKARQRMLEDIKHQLEQRGVMVLVDLENGVLRLPEQLLFPRGDYKLTPQGHDALEKLADVLSVVLPCYAASSEHPQMCPGGSPAGRLEAVFIEGHTDDVPILGRMANGVSDNWELSTERAIETFKALTTQAPSLELLANSKLQKLLGVSGYGKDRPARSENTEEARAANRRIDLRFLMETPTSQEVERIKKEVERGDVP